MQLRQVTQLNNGKKTAGVGEVKLLNPKERLQLVVELDSMKDWKHRKLRRVFISKAKWEIKTTRYTNHRDRAMQCLVKYAFEPVYESYASDGSYGFRPGHSTWDIQNRLFQNLKRSANGYTKSILEMDIEGCFDNINHD